MTDQDKCHYCGLPGTEKYRLYPGSYPEKLSHYSCLELALERLAEAEAREKKLRDTIQEMSGVGLWFLPQDCSGNCLGCIKCGVARGVDEELNLLAAKALAPDEGGAK